MDSHPLFVHFPIALLTLYSFLEVIKRFTKNEHWVQVRAVLVIAGTIGAFVSLSTGKRAEQLFGDRTLHDILEAHAIAANATTWIYAVFAVSYLILWLQQTTTHPPLLQRILGKARLGEPLAAKVLGTPVAPVLAVLGFLGLSLTGALGAMLVYGPQFDPVTSLVYNLLSGREKILLEKTRGTNARVFLKVKENYTLETLSAFGPFLPCPTSNCTVSPSWRELKDTSTRSVV